MTQNRHDTSRFSFTAARLHSLHTPANGRACHHDTKVAGLCLYVTVAGSKTFYWYRWVNGRPQRLRLGKFPEVSIDAARKAAAKLAGEVAQGLDPTAERRAKRDSGSVTFGDLWLRWEEFMTEHKKPKSRGEDERYYRTHLEKWAKRPLSEVTRTDVAGLHTRVGRKHGKYTANRLLALISAMFSEARRTGLYEKENPCAGIRRFKEKSRDRWLDGDELKAFFTALSQEPQPFPDFYILLLLTGARKTNTMKMRWEQLDLEQGLWRIPDTKGGMPVVVPLVEPALLILRRRLQEAVGNAWVFPGRSLAGHIAPTTRKWQCICERAGLQNCRLHDLRRTLGSWMATQGASLPVIGKSLGHRSQASTEVYARLGVSPVREALDKATSAMLEAGGMKLLDHNRDAEHRD